MGCDIHAVLERKFGDKWIGIEVLRHRYAFIFNDEEGAYENDHLRYIGCKAIDRNYALFAALAGVRGEGPEAKGLPNSAPELSRALLFEYDDDLHSHSWCSLSEYIEKLLATMTNPAEVFLREDHPALKDPYKFFFCMYTLEEGEEYRVVFAFDN
jgi:hypothetical protein